MHWSQQTPSANNTREDSTHGHPQMVNTKIRHNLVTKQQQRNSRYIRAKLTKTIKKKMKTERSDTFKKKIKNEITADFSSKRNITYCIVWGTQCSVVAKGIYVHMLLNHFAVEQKLTQHCKSAIFQ